MGQRLLCRKRVFDWRQRLHRRRIYQHSDCTIVTLFDCGYNFPSVWQRNVSCWMQQIGAKPSFCPQPLLLSPFPLPQRHRVHGLVHKLWLSVRCDIIESGLNRLSLRYGHIQILRP